MLLIIFQSILALTINRLGMSLLRMDKPSDAVRFLDDFDLTLSIDNRPIAAQQMSNIELTLQPVVFRVSYRDIHLITSIVNKAIELSTPSQPADTAKLSTQSIETSKLSVTSDHHPQDHAASTTTISSSKALESHVITSKEHVSDIHQSDNTENADDYHVSAQGKFRWLPTCPHRRFA
jgi:vacuolar protein sorting-associated protein 13A/C